MASTRLVGERVVDGIIYITPLHPFTGTKGEKTLLKKWLDHYKRLGISTIVEPSIDGTNVILLVNKEQNEKMWTMDCMVGECYIRPPDPMFGEPRDKISD